jgi:hypothetical protein
MIFLPLPPFGQALRGRKSFIRSFVKEIKVTGAEVLLTYTMPLPPEGTLEEKMPVLYSVHPSGAEVMIGSTFEMVFSLHI